MAGASSSWFKGTAGPFKGVAVYVSGAQQAALGLSPAQIQHLLDTKAGGPQLGPLLNKDLPHGVAQPTPVANMDQLHQTLLTIVQANGLTAVKVAQRQGALAVVDTPYGHSVIHVPSGKALLYVGSAGQPTAASQQQALGVMQQLLASGATWDGAAAEALGPAAQAALMSTLGPGITPSKLTFVPPADVTPLPPPVVGATSGQLLPGQCVDLAAQGLFGVTVDLQDGLTLHQDAASGIWLISHLGSGLSVVGTKTRPEALGALDALQQLGVAWTDPSDPKTVCTPAQLTAIKAIRATALAGGYAPPAPPPAPATVVCRHCDHPNPPGTTQCAQCGTALVTTIGATGGKAIPNQTFLVKLSTQPAKAITGVIWDGLTLYKAGKQWAVGHLGSGKQLAQFPTMKQARLLAQALHALGVDWTQGTPVTTLADLVPNAATQAVVQTCIQQHAAQATAAKAATAATGATPAAAPAAPPAVPTSSTPPGIPALKLPSGVTPLAPAQLQPATITAMTSVAATSATVAVAAQVWGPFAIHPALGGGPTYTLTHVASGYPLATGFVSQADALIGLAVAQHNAPGVDWSYTSKQQLKADAANFAKAATLGKQLKQLAAQSGVPRPTVQAAPAWRPPGGVPAFSSLAAHQQAIQTAYAAGSGFVRDQAFEPTVFHAISAYQDGHFDAINAALWKPGGLAAATEQTRTEIAQLDRAMRLASVPFNMTVVRSHSSSHPLYTQMATLQVGDAYVQRGFDSASVNATNSWGGGHVRVQYRLPQGAKALFLNALHASPNLPGYHSQYPGEHECLLARQSHWQVVGKTVTAQLHSGPPKIEVVVELIAQPKPNDAD